MTAGAPRDAAGLLSRLLDAERAHLRPRDILAVLSLVLGDRVQVGDASRYLFEYARRAGYDLPPYPLAGCGEIREFFADEGVRNVPEWYERKLGVPSQLYAQLSERTLVVARDAEYRRKAFVLDGVRHLHDAGFANLLDSGLERSLASDDLAELLIAVMAFLLGESEGQDGSVAGEAAARHAGVVRFASRVF